MKTQSGNWKTKILIFLGWYQSNLIVQFLKKQQYLDTNAFSWNKSSSLSICMSATWTLRFPLTGKREKFYGVSHTLRHHTLQRLPLLLRTEGSSLVSFQCCEVIPQVKKKKRKKPPLGVSLTARLERPQLGTALWILASKAHSCTVPSLASAFAGWMSQDADHVSVVLARLTLMLDVCFRGNVTVETSHIFQLWVTMSQTGGCGGSWSQVESIQKWEKIDSLADSTRWAFSLASKRHSFSSCLIRFLWVYKSRGAITPPQCDTFPWHIKCRKAIYIESHLSLLHWQLTAGLFPDRAMLSQ